MKLIDWCEMEHNGGAKFHQSGGHFVVSVSSITGKKSCDVSRIRAQVDLCACARVFVPETETARTSGHVVPVARAAPPLPAAATVQVKYCPIATHQMALAIALKRVPHERNLKA